MRSVSLIFFISISLSQWTTFKLAELSDFSKDSPALYRKAGFASTHSYPLKITGENRISLGGSMLKGFSSNGLLPILQGKVKVSWNLYLRGRMAAYTAKEGAVQMYGWGLSLRPGKEDKPSKWVINFDSGRLNSHDELKVSAIQASAIREIGWNKFPIHLGFGMNILKANQYSFLGNDYPGKTEIQTNFINFGTAVSLSGLEVIPQIWLGSEYAMVSVNIVGKF